MRLGLALLAFVVVTASAQVGTKPSSHSFSLAKDVEWVNVDGISLHMDIYTPNTGKKQYPVFVIFHGGGWLINDKSIMNEMAQYMASNSEYVICNVDYRLLPFKGNSVTMNQIIEDAFGAVLWIKENISRYQGDPERLAVSGDSAGGHLAAMVALGAPHLESDGFAGNSLGFRPTYIPSGMTPENIARKNGAQVQAAVLNYPAVDIYKACLGSKGDGSDGFESASNVFWQFANAPARGIFGTAHSVASHPQMYKFVSPMHMIPGEARRKLPPMLCTVGTKDDLTTPSSVKGFVDALNKAGHATEYWEHAGRPHAFLDSGSNQFLGTSFEKDAPEAIDRIIVFLNSVFN